MKVLFDQGVPFPLAASLAGHEVHTAHELGWSRIKNGDLLTAADSAGFEVLVTTDQHLRHQQNLSNRKIAVVVLMTTSWPKIQRKLADVVSAVGSAQQGTYTEVTIA